MVNNILIALTFLMTLRLFMDAARIAILNYKMRKAAKNYLPGAPVIDHPEMPEEDLERLRQMQLARQKIVLSQADMNKLMNKEVVEKYQPHSTMPLFISYKPFQ